MLRRLSSFFRLKFSFLLIGFFSLAFLVQPVLAAGDEEGEVASFVPLMLAIALILLGSRVGGAIARVLKQPRVLGQLIMGVILGPTVLDMLHWGVFQGIDLGHTVTEFAELGVVLLMFNIGLEVHFKELQKVGLIAVLAGLLGAILPVVLTMAVLMPAGFIWQQSLFAGVTMAATSVSISAQVLLELGYLQRKEGNALLATALVDDVLAIVLLSLTVAVVGGGAEAETLDIGSLMGIVLQMTIYIVVAFLIAWFIVPPVMRWISKQPAVNRTNGIPIFALILALLFSWSAQALGEVAAITGAFIAGLGLSRLPEKDMVREKDDIEESISTIAYVLLVPIFFINVGLSTDLSGFPLEAVPLMLLLLAVAVISKVVGSGVGARVGGFNNWESIRLGVCMISRGEVGLIIISVGLTSGILDATSDLFAALFMVIILTTVFTPPLVRWVFQQGSDIVNNDTATPVATHT